jgi:hypothetical protein
MMDALTLLRAYLAGDETAIMSRAHVEAVIAEIERLQGHLMHANTSVAVLRAELAAATKRIHLEEMNADAWRAEYEKTRAALAAELERKKSYMKGEITEYERADKLREALVRADVQLRRLDYEGELLAAIDAALKETGGEL